MRTTMQVISYIRIDDQHIVYIAYMHVGRVLLLSHTGIRGTYHWAASANSAQKLS